MHRLVFVFMMVLMVSGFGDEVERYINQQPYTSVSNRPCLVLFSGPPGSGKTTLAIAMQHKYHAMRISTDELRSAVGRAEAGAMCWQILERIYEKKHNQLVILDASIDRRFSSLKEWADAHGFPLFTIRMKIPRSIALRRLEAREGKKAFQYLKHFSGWWQDYEQADNLPFDHTFDAWTRMITREQRKVFRAFEKKHTDARMASLR